MAVEIQVWLMVTAWSRLTAAWRRYLAASDHLVVTLPRSSLARTLSQALSKLEWNIHLVCYLHISPKKLTSQVKSKVSIHGLITFRVTDSIVTWTDVSGNLVAGSAARLVYQPLLFFILSSWSVVLATIPSIFPPTALLQFTTTNTSLQPWST